MTVVKVAILAQQACADDGLLAVKYVKHLRQEVGTDGSQRANANPVSKRSDSHGLGAMQG
jgi:hypothetical protein